VDIFAHSDYKSLTLAWVKTRANNGRGQLQRMAKHLNASSTFISQVLRGDRDLSADQALELCAYFEFSQLECEYYILLVQKARAASAAYREYIEEKLRAVQRKSSNLKARIDVDRELNDVQKARFYSSWHYAAIRNLLALPGGHNSIGIAHRLNLEMHVVDEALEFLLESKLCVMEQGRVVPGPKITHLEASSPLVKSRQVQWRLKAFEAMDRANSKTLFYTCPMSLSAETKNQIRALLVQTIQDLLAKVKDSPSEELACLNIDWFSF
jgi:uncharacterized protein (TIGR02147 family)